MRSLFLLIAAVTTTAGLLTATGSAAGGTSHSGGKAKPGACASRQHAKVGRFSGIVHAQRIASISCTSDPAQGDPPLYWFGGPVMRGPVTVTPIYWEPTGYSNADAYRSLINQYLSDVAAASGSDSNVFSTATEYYDDSGSISYNLVAGTPIRDHNKLAGHGCTVGKLDKKGIYADGSGYTACLDDAQVTAEVQKVAKANHLPQTDYAHIYVMFLPKHVASCFYKGSTADSSNVCTIDHYDSATYCAYHGMYGPNYPDTGTVYATMPFPIYASPVGYTCGSDAGDTFPTLESPNGNPDADVEISPTSHEIMEAITDPNVYDGWYDVAGYENGDECAYVYGAASGTDGALYNQTINGHNYLTQEEFSNNDFFNTSSQGGCVQSESAVTP
jgi:hypothetical protein